MFSRDNAALLFDIDGTLVDTDRLHLEAFNRVFGPLGQTFDAARFRAELQGFSMTSIMDRLLGNEPEPRRHEIMAEKEATFRRLAEKGLEPMPGLLALLDRADEAGLPMAAVTNAPRLNADLILDALGIRHRFTAIVIGDELAHGKPHPLPYLEGLRLTGARPDLSVAFEDSISGVTSASTAGIATVGIMTSLTGQRLLAAGATTVAQSYAEPALLAFIAATTAGSR
ncbi:MAG: HAD-IA family hydrolase [Devosia nanyangense]|uniref:HAD-IA family hydrolase n=1 Tax=Devosia nanyangense TaxID=1228055 RepID=A0A933L4T4_9HYPH|nr:HAD-IA family hydrolase [Devosia nanyangense]